MLARRLRASHHGYASSSTRQSYVLRRQFHASRPNKLIVEAIQLSHDFFQTVHGVTGLSWAVSIPLTAVLARMAYLPVQYYIFASSQKRNETSPLLVAWRKVYQTRAVALYPQKTETAARQAERWVQTSMKSKRKSLYQKHKILGPWGSVGLSLGFLPIWVLNADVIRRMAGNETSIFGVITGSGEKVNTALVPAEPGFLTEGFAWIPTLVNADPFWILPITFGALQLANIWFAGGKDISKGKAEIAAMPPGIARTQRNLMVQLTEVMMALTVVFPYLLISNEVPSAVLLYLVGSSACQLIQRPLLKMAMGVKPGIEPAEKRLPKLRPGYGRRKQP